MKIDINSSIPSVMHVDLNSCFATCEAQANPFLRGRPIAVAAYTGDSGCVISPSYEAKAYGVKVGCRVRDAKLLCPEIKIIAPHPKMYRAVHQQFNKIFRDYTPIVTPKSIDEAVLDFKDMQKSEQDLIDIGYEIKDRMRKEIGCWISNNVGIGTNRFLAKTAAGLHKPNGLDVINSKNLLEVYKSLELMDLCGINTRYKLRLNVNGIYTPTEFLEATVHKLKKQTFKSIVGYYWYMRLRGFEIDNVDFGRKSYGQSYALHKFTGDIEELSRLLMKLCEKMGRRLRTAGYYAKGIHVGVAYKDFGGWHRGMKVQENLYTTQELYKLSKRILSEVKHMPCTHIFVSCFDLRKFDVQQESLFDPTRVKRWQVSKSLDNINDRYGEYVVLPSATMKDMETEIIDRVPFGSTKDLVDLYDTGAYM